MPYGVGIFGVVVLGALAAGWSRPHAEAGMTVIRPPHEVSALALRGNRLWAGGEEGLTCIDTVTGLVETNPGVPALQGVRALACTSDGTLWIGHADGLGKLGTAGYESYTERAGLPDNRIQCLMVDAENRLWAGTLKGAVCISDKAEKPLNRNAGLLDDMVNTMTETTDGVRWFGSYTAPRGGISLLLDGTRHVFAMESGLPHNNINRILQVRDGSVWAATGFLDRGGAVRFVRDASGTWKIDSTLTHEDGLAGEKVRSLFQDDAGVLWMGSEYDGLTLVNGRRMLVLTTAEGLSNNEIKAIVQGPDGTVWLGTRDGVTRISGERVRLLHRQIGVKQ